MANFDERSKSNQGRGGRAAKQSDILFVHVLDLESPLRKLHDLVVALTLVLSDGHGIEAEDMPGARAVARAARESMDELLEAWRATMEQAKGQRVRNL